MQNKTLRLLFLDTSENTSEDFITLVNSPKLVVSAHRVTKATELIESLRNKVWDIIVINDEVRDINIGECVQSISKNNRIVSLLILTATEIGTEEITKAYKAGVSAIVSLSLPEYLKAVVSREFSIVKQRQQLVEKELNNSELIKRCQLLLDGSGEAVAYVHEGMHIYANKSYMQKFMYTDLDDLICVPIIDMVIEEYQEGLKSCLTQTQLEEESGDINDKGTVFDMVGLCANGLEFRAQLFLKPTLYEGEKCLQVLVSTEEEEKKNLRRVTNRDTETGLFNRHFFLTQLDDFIKHVSAGKSTGGLLLYIGLDNFDAVRSEVGHDEAHDSVLEVAKLLKNDVAKKHVSARFGDSTFTILLDAGDDLENLDEMLATIKHKIEDFEPKCLEDKDITISCSVLTAEINRNAKSAKEIMDVAYRQSRGVDNEPEELEEEDVPAEEDESSEVVDVLTKEYINQAMFDNSFALAYQPIIAVSEVEAEIYEIYLRLYDESGNLYMPEQFMPVVDKNGLGNRLDRWVIDNALQVLVDLYNRGQTVQFVLNITEQSMKDALFAEWLAKSMKECCLGSEAVVVNLYEETVVKNAADASHLIGKLLEVDASVCISRYTNSSKIVEFLDKTPVSLVKLAEEITENMIDDSSYQPTLKEMIKYLHTKEIKVIAPQIEDSNVLSKLWIVDVDFLQGDYFQKAEEDMSFDSFNEQIEM